MPDDFRSKLNGLLATRSPHLAPRAGEQSAETQGLADTSRLAPATRIEGGPTGRDPRAKREVEGEHAPGEERAKPLVESGGALDPLVRAFAMTPSAALPEPVSPTSEQQALALSPLIWERLVKRVSWGRGAVGTTVRLEIGAGQLEGAVLLLTETGQGLSVELALPPGAQREEWERRVGQALQRGGVSPESLVVR